MTGSGQAGSEITKYYYAGSQRIAIPQGDDVRKNGTLTFIIGDHLGSTSLVTDASGNVINQTQYKAWGETRYSSGSEQTKYTYTGQYSYVSDFGLHFYNARWYDSSLSRFAQADTIVPGGVQGYDRYAYTKNNPVRYTDPSGHCPEEDSGCRVILGQTLPGGGTSTPAPVVKVCGSNGPDGLAREGPGCSGESQIDDQLTVWDTETFPGMNFLSPSTYPGSTELEPNGKYKQAILLDNLLGNQPHVTLIGYSSGTQVILLVAELRDSRGLVTDLIMLGPPIGETQETYVMYDDPYNQNGVTESQFIARTQATAANGNHVLVIDDIDNGTGYSNFVNGFSGYTNTSYYHVGVPDVPGATGHSYSDDLPAIAEVANYWLTHNYQLP